MPSANWEHIAEIIVAARELPAAEREQFLSEACQGDEVLLGKLKSLMKGAEAFPSVLGISSPPDDEGLIGTPFNSKVSTIDFNKPDELVGQVLEGRFLIEKNLTDGGADKGGIGLVYLARQIRLMDREVVVKILQKQAQENSEIKRKFQHEQEALILLKHPNIVDIIDVGTLPDGNPFIVMEYIPGFSLRKLLRERLTLPFDLSAHIIESVTQALGVAHSKKILHRDIKPENIMLAPQEGDLYQVKLIDFGIARVVGAKLAPETSVGYTVGTLRYMAPEQLNGQLIQTPAVDIYAISLVAYEMMIGSLPFMPRSSQLVEAAIELYEMQKKGLPAKPSSLCPGLSSEAEDLLLSGLEYEPAKRPADARKFGKHLAEALRKAQIASEGNIPNSRPVPVQTADQKDAVVVEKQDKGSLIGLKTAPTEPIEPISVVTIVKAKENDPAGAKSPPITSRNQSIVTAGIPDEPDFKFNDTNHSRSSSGKSKKPFLWFTLALLAAAILAILAVPAGINYWNASRNAPANKTEMEAGNDKNANNAAAAGMTTGTDRKISYFLNVQKMRNGKPFEAPFKSLGKEIYESGYKFNLVFQPDADGYMYVFNEGKDDAGKVGFNLLFPTPNINNGTSRVSAGQNIETAKNTFNGGKGTEVMWMIWVKQKSDDLESLIKTVIVPPGTVKDESTGTLRKFFAEYNDGKADLSKDQDKQQMIVKTKGDAVVYRFELEHR